MATGRSTIGQLLLWSLGILTANYDAQGPSDGCPRSDHVRLVASLSCDPHTPCLWIMIRASRSVLV
jgi:hypothetical protein